MQTQPALDNNSVDLDPERELRGQRGAITKPPCASSTANAKTMLSAIQGHNQTMPPNGHPCPCSPSSTCRQRHQRAVAAPQRGGQQPGQCRTPWLRPPVGHKARQVVFRPHPWVPTAPQAWRHHPGVRESARRRCTTPTLADAQGYVTHSNVNAVEEMVNMISGLALVPEQRRGHEHSQVAAPQDPTRWASKRTPSRRLPHDHQQPTHQTSTAATTAAKASNRR